MESLDSPFCPQCQSVLPPIGLKKEVICYSCKTVLDARRFSNIGSEYTIHFNPVENADIFKKTDSREPDGPVVERLCIKCGNTVMSYATIQLRSADEGQTIFYTCTKCKYTESENS